MKLTITKVRVAEISAPAPGTPSADMPCATRLPFCR
mgnify:CR=1 FL=1